MEFAELGSGGPRVSRIGFGCAAIGGYDYGSVDDVESTTALRAAVDSGVTLFDAADVYGFGRAEQVLGAALEAGGSPHVLVATKVGVRWDDAGRTTRDLSRAWILRAADDSLRRLRVDRIDLYQMHWPDPHTPIEESMTALLELRERGKIGHIGCCNFGPELVREALRFGPVVSSQLPYSVGDRTREADIRECETAGVPTLAYNVLAHGLFSGRYGRGSSFHGTDLRRRNPLFGPDELARQLPLVDALRDAAYRCERTLTQVAARWALQRSGIAVALTGAKSAAQIRENVGACGWTLPQDEIGVLERAYERSTHPNATL